MMAEMEDVEVVLANNDRVTLRVGDVFLKVDADQARTDAEVAAMAMAPVPTAKVLWRKPPVLALGALPGTHSAGSGAVDLVSGSVGCRGCRHTDAARRAAAAVARPERRRAGPRLDHECEWLVANDVLPADVVTRNRRLAETVLRPWTPAFIHGDLHIAHVFVDGDEVTGIIDWSEGCQGDALFDLATLTLANEEHLGDVIAGYGNDVDRDLIRAWWSYRCLVVVRWLAENGYGSPETFPEVAVLRSRT